MNFTVNNRKISGTISAIKYASMIHKYLICQALTPVHEGLLTPHFSKDLEVTMNCLRALGLDSEDAGNGKHICYLECGQSENSFRMLLPVAAALGRSCELHMDENLMAEPFSELLRTLKIHGIRHDLISRRSMRIWGKMTAGTFIIPSGISSQFISGMLFALPLLPENSLLMIDGNLKNKNDILMTLSVLKEAGIEIDAKINDSDDKNANLSKRKGTFVGASFKIRGNQKYQLEKMPEIEGDWTAASYFLTAGAICGSTVTVSGLDINTLQKEKKILDILTDAGVQVGYNSTRIRVTGPGQGNGNDGISETADHLKAFETDAREIYDIIPAAALLASKAIGVSCIHNIYSDEKEKDMRIRRMIRVMDLLGIRNRVSDNDLYIEGQSGSDPLSGGTIGCGGDDRIAMMEGIASSICGSPLIIVSAEAAEKTYPGFFEDLMMLQRA